MGVRSVVALVLTAALASPAFADTTPTPQPSPTQPLLGVQQPGSQGYTRAGDPLRRPGVLWKRKPSASGAAVPAPPAPPAKAWILIDSASGDVLAASNARKQLPPASTLKTLTAVTLMPRLNPSRVYTATAADVGIEGSGAGLVRGGTYTIKQLFIGLLLPSGNDAAVALTHAYHPSMTRAITLMNSSAKRLGAVHTKVRNPHGLPNDQQVTTVADMALIANAAIHLREFREIAKLKTYQFPGNMPKAGKPRASYQLQNENPLIKHGISGTLGGKTGYTRKALRTYWGAVKRGDRTLIVVVFGFVGPTYTYSSKLLNWGFANADRLTPVGQLPTQMGNRWQTDAIPLVAPTAANPTSTAYTSESAAPAASAAPNLLGAAEGRAKQATTWLLFLIPAGILTRRALRYRRLRA